MGIQVGGLLERVQLHGDDAPAAHQRLGRLLRVPPPDLRRNVVASGAAVLVGQGQRQRRRHAAEIGEINEIDVAVLRQGPLQRGAFPILQRIQKFLVGVAILVGDRVPIVPIVEVFQFRSALDVDLPAFLSIAALNEGLGEARRIFQLALGKLDVWILGGHLELPHPGHRHIHMLRAVEPGAPEPVQVHRRGVLHGAEEIRRRGALEPPAPGVFAEGEVEQRPAQHRLPQHHERRRRLAVGVRPELQDGIRLGHHRHLVFAAHVAGNLIQDALKLPVGVEILLPLPLGDVLQEAVDALVHPSPLALVGIDDHGEIVVPHFMDDDPDQPLLGFPGPSDWRLRRPVLDIGGFGAVAVEGDHGIFHAAALPGIHRLHGWIGVGEGEARIDA